MGFGSGGPEHASSRSKHLKAPRAEDSEGVAGLEWTEDLRRFDRTARARGVSTASARQVRRGLFDGTRQWEPYAEYLAPVMPTLQPWIEKLGYAS